MEVDTGSGDSLISEDLFQSVLGGSEVVELSPPRYTLFTYTQHPLELLGEAKVQVSHNNQSKILPLMVVKGRGPSLLGRLWLQELQLDWKQVYKVHNLTTSDGFMSQHKKLFGDDLMI